MKASEKIVYEDDEDETAGDATFMNKNAVEKADTIYTNIGESSAGKRKKAGLDLESDGKNSSCKVCSLF